MGCSRWGVEVLLSREGSAHRQPAHQPTSDPTPNPSPPGVNPRRLLEGFGWSEFQWRRGELTSQFEGRSILIAVDDMDVFKGIELKLQVRGEVWGREVLGREVRGCGKFGREGTLVRLTNPRSPNGSTHF